MLSRLPFRRIFAIVLVAQSVFFAGDLVAQAPQPASKDGIGTYVLIHAEDLKPAAEEWAAYRSQAGWDVLQHSVAPSDDSQATSKAIQQFIRETYRQHRPAKDDLFAVLLLGDADESGVPTWYFPQHDPVMKSGRLDDDHYASDHPYQVIDGEANVPDIALGRVPARTVEEARMVLEKIKRHEAAAGSGHSPGIGRNRIVYAAGEGRFGAMDSILETLFKSMVDRLVPEAFDLSMTYAKASSVYCPPPSQLTATVLERMTEGALLFNYVGHGFEKGFDSLHWRAKRYPILRVNDLQRLPAVTGDEPMQRPIAFLSCCSVGWFDLPEGERSLAEAMLFHPSGPVAIIAGSRITHPYANTVLQMDITRSMLVEREPTVGLLDLRAAQSLLVSDDVDRELDAIAAPLALAGKWKTGLRDLRRMHVKLYNLLGDPATRIDLPANAVVDLTLMNAQLSGRIEGMETGRVKITVETARTAFADETKMQPRIGDDDPDLEAKAAINYPLANARVLSAHAADVKDGRFEVTLPEPLPANWGVIRLYAEGLDAQGGFIDAIGALRRPAPPPTPTTQPSP